MKLRMEDLEQVTGGAGQISGKNRTGDAAAKNGRAGSGMVIRIHCKRCPSVFEADITKDEAVCPDCGYPNPING